MGISRLVFGKMFRFSGTTASDGKVHRNAGAEPGLEDISGGNSSKSSKDGRNQPVERGYRQPQPLIPDTGEAVCEAFRSDADRLVGMGAGSESVHYHHRLAESARHKEIGDVFYSSRGPNTDNGGPDKIQPQHKNVRNVQSQLWH
jgi:hypothetical protein